MARLFRHVQLVGRYSDQYEMSSRRFYLTLPSNSSMNYYPSNMVARYTTKLPQVMELEGDWEVALAEITVPSPLPKVTRDTHFFTLRSTDTDETHKYTLRWGYYDTGGKVVTEMNSLTRAHPTGVAFRYQLKRVKLVNNDSYDVEFSDALPHMLEFYAGTRYQPRNVGHSAPRTIDLSSVIVPTLYVTARADCAVCPSAAAEFLVLLVQYNYRLYTFVHL